MDMADDRNPLERVSLRQLRYFGAAMQAESFNQAAKDCAISQPALSEQIAALEATLGMCLFDRVGRRAMPTQPAVQLNRRISACMSDLQAALRAAGERSESVSGLVRVGLVGSYGGCWVTPVVRAAQARWPGLAISLSRRTVPALNEGVARGDLDIAVCLGPSPYSEVEAVDCFTEPFVAVARGHRRKPIGLDELARRPLALMPAEYAMRRQIDSLFAAAGLVPLVRLESDALEDLVQAAQQGGVTAIVNAATALSLGVRGAVPVDAPAVVRTACVMRSRTRFQTRAALYLWDRLLQEAAALKNRLAIPENTPARISI